MSHGDQGVCDLKPPIIEVPGRLMDTLRGGRFGGDYLHRQRTPKSNVMKPGWLLVTRMPIVFRLKDSTIVDTTNSKCLLPGDSLSLTPLFRLSNRLKRELKCFGLRRHQ